MKDHDFESQVKQVLHNKIGLSNELELALITQVESVLAARRERVASVEAATRQSNQVKARRLILLRKMGSWLSELFAIHPDTPAVATTFIVLMLAIMTFHDRPSIVLRVSYADLPELPKTNDFPARYDAQLLAERQDYEREVEDAHKKTNGGI